MNDAEEIVALVLDPKGQTAASRIIAKAILSALEKAGYGVYPHLPDGVYRVRDGVLRNIEITEKGRIAFAKWFAQLDAEDAAPTYSTLEPHRNLLADIRDVCDEVPSAELEKE